MDSGMMKQRVFVILFGVVFVSVYSGFNNVDEKEIKHTEMETWILVEEHVQGENTEQREDSSSDSATMEKNNTDCVGETTSMRQQFDELKRKYRQLNADTMDGESVDGGTVPKPVQVMANQYESLKHVAATSSDVDAVTNPRSASGQAAANLMKTLEKRISKLFKLIGEALEKICRESRAQVQVFSQPKQAIKWVDEVVAGALNSLEKLIRVYEDGTQLRERASRGDTARNSDGGYAANTGTGTTSTIPFSGTPTIVSRSKSV